MAKENVDLLPEEVRTMSFSLLKTLPSSGARLGRLTIRKRVFETPTYVGNTSRGTIPHLSQDNYQKHTNIHAAYVSLEDFVEKGPKQTPPIYKLNSTSNGSSFKGFIALPQDDILIMGARRTPAIPCPGANTNSSISILTSVGFRVLTNADYAEAITKLQPDIVIALGDVVYPIKEERSIKRIDRMGDRTLKWTQDLIASQKLTENTSAHIFAPVLPVDIELQREWLDELSDPNIADRVFGLSIYSVDSIPDLPTALSSLPRFALTEPSSPSNLLREISLGIDIFTIPFISVASEAGIALDFSFPPPPAANDGVQKSLGADMWNTDYAVNVKPLAEGCTCYACQNHHQAYVHHLLGAKEMLAWVLLQIHNHHVLDVFFASIRQSIAGGTFEEAAEAFDRVYETKLPEQTGQGPRLRGYQFKSEGPGEAKKNAKVYHRLDDMQERFQETPLTPSPGLDGEDLERVGFAEKADEQTLP